MKREQGFSLLEILVAFTILSLSLGVLLRVFAGNVQLAAVSGDYTHAILLAESRLAEVTAITPEEGETIGKFGDRFLWITSIRLYYPGLEELDLETLSVSPYRIQVKVAWGTGDSPSFHNPDDPPAANQILEIVVKILVAEPAKGGIHPNFRERQIGFTLVEVLIGMTLLAVMMALIFGAFRIGVTSWDAGEKRVIETNNLLIVQSFLRSRIMSAQPLFDDFGDDEKEFSFIGTENSLQFVSSLPARGGFQKFILFFDNENEGMLKISVEPFFPTFDGSDSVKNEVVLLEAIKQMNLSYFGSSSFGEEADWQDQWEDQENLPDMIKLDLKFLDKSNQSWPPFLVRLRIASNQS